MPGASSGSLIGAGFMVSSRTPQFSLKQYQGHWCVIEKQKKPKDWAKIIAITERKGLALVLLREIREKK